MEDIRSKKYNNKLSVTLRIKESLYVIQVYSILISLKNNDQENNYNMMIVNIVFYSYLIHLQFQLMINMH